MERSPRVGGFHGNQGEGHEVDVGGSVLLLWASSVTAQTTTEEEYSKRIRAATTVEPLTHESFDAQVNLYNGSTEFSVPLIDPMPVQPTVVPPRTGGGIEFIFPNGTPPGSVSGPYPLPPGN